MKNLMMVVLIFIASGPLKALETDAKASLEHQRLCEQITQQQTDLNQRISELSQSQEKTTDVLLRQRLGGALDELVRELNQATSLLRLCQ